MKTDQEAVDAALKAVQAALNRVTNTHPDTVHGPVSWACVVRATQLLRAAQTLHQELTRRHSEQVVVP